MSPSQLEGLRLAVGALLGLFMWSCATVSIAVALVERRQRARASAPRSCPPPAFKIEFARSSVVSRGGFVPPTSATPGTTPPGMP